MFTKQKSLIVKGAAVIMMLWHHCFLSGRYDGFSISFFPLSEGQVQGITAFFKICVSLFVFVSGYGLFQSYEKYTSHCGRACKPGRWITERYCRTMSGFWFMAAAAVVVCMVINGRPVHVYGFRDSILHGLANMLLDFLGLSNFFGTPSLNGTWWYMSAAVVYIVLTPGLYVVLKKLGGLCTLGILFALPRMFGGFPGDTHFLSFLPSFCIGMIFAKDAVFEKWDALWQRISGKTARFMLRFLLLVAVIFVCYKLYRLLPIAKLWDVQWGILPVAVVLFLSDCAAEIPGINHILRYFGEHSANIFWVHTFIRGIYLQDFIYSRGHFLLVILALLLTSLACSIVLELLKKGLRYERWFERITLCNQNNPGEQET